MENTLIRELVHDSGLSAGQVGRLFGTVSRNVHRWMQGTPLPDHHEPRAKHLLEQITPLADTPAERRLVLLDSSNGPSVFRQLMGDAPTDQQIHHSIPVAQLFGIGA
ncbi:hypothetical protein LG293_16035 (plasmid) [Citricoccus nitrophenolicus]